jgi:hypothetical protein
MRAVCAFAIAATLLALTPASRAAEQSPAPAAPPSALSTRANVRAIVDARQPALGIIEGNALDSNNAPLPNTLVRLRDVRYGRIVASQLTDKAGLFAFHDVEPGSYIVELLARDQTTVLAASQVVNISGNETMSVVVKLPFRLARFGGVLRDSIGSAAIVTSVAAAATVLALTTHGEPTCPTGPNK